MKLPLFLAGAAVLGLGAGFRSAEEVVVIVSGDTHGYLSPCGCTKPMSGGIRRRAAAVRVHTAGKRSIVLENGGLIKGIGRQDEMKAETLAEALKEMGCDAINLTSTDAAAGRGVIDSVSRLSGAPFVTSSVANQSNLPLRDSLAVEGAFVVGLSTKSSLLARDLKEPEVALDDALDLAILKAGQLPVVVLLEGSESEAKALAEGHPAVKLIVFSSIGDPPSEPVRVGECLLVTPGEKGKTLIRLKFDGRKFDGYATIKLDPTVTDDPKTARIYDRYLGRIVSEKLLERLPRIETPKYAGNTACGGCHAEAMVAWELSRHAGALHTLEIEKHDRDPDCVRCHVVGLESLFGFVSRKDTPHLTDVGCESCHGPGAEHARDPGKSPMPKVGEMACITCHDRENSPNFDFKTYWQKIKH